MSLTGSKTLWGLEVETRPPIKSSHTLSGCQEGLDYVTEFNGIKLFGKHK
ncbi:hypothetical protein KEJ19_07665 [Candidatus Bathyarchaeota archaeon]|nr:hypothetical protein [Candidatus Bathyarchaeota archaeon]